MFKEEKSSRDRTYHIRMRDLGVSNRNGVSSKKDLDLKKD